MIMGIFEGKAPANVEYHGSDRTTRSCLDAIARLLSSGLQIHRVLLLSHGDRHGFYIEADEPAPFLIRCGFASGYYGEGPAGLSIALHLFRRFEIDVEEVEVKGEVLNRLDSALLNEYDLESIHQASPVRPTRMYDYMHDGLQHRASPGKSMRRQFSPIVPWFLLDERLIDLAVVLPRDPDKAVMDAFRRLESSVKSRCALAKEVFGVEVFKKAFRGSGAILGWPDLPAAEIEGRAQLFEAAFKAYRNPRAHRDDPVDVARAYREFFLLNELFLLEAEAVLMSR